MSERESEREMGLLYLFFLAFFFFLRGRGGRDSCMSILPCCPPMWWLQTFIWRGGLTLPFVPAKVCVCYNCAINLFIRFDFRLPYTYPLHLSFCPLIMLFMLSLSLSLLPLFFCSLSIMQCMSFIFFRRNVFIHILIDCIFYNLYFCCCCCCCCCYCCCCCLTHLDSNFCCLRND